jgi:hypothetical protein
MIPNGRAAYEIHAAKGVKQMKTHSIVKAALGGGAAILLGGLLQGSGVFRSYPVLCGM